MIGIKGTVNTISPDTEKNLEQNKIAKKNSSIEDRFNEAIKQENETLVNELIGSVDFFSRTIDSSRNGQPMLITLIEHDHTSAALKIINKPCLSIDSDIINFAMYKALKKSNDVLINALSTHEYFDPDVCVDQRFVFDFKKPLLCEFVNHRTSDIALRVMREKTISFNTRRMVLEEAINREIPYLIEGILKIFSIEKSEIHLQSRTLIKLFEKKYISASCFKNAVLEGNISFCKVNAVNFIYIINLLVKAKNVMKLNSNLFLTLSKSLERNLENMEASDKDKLFTRIHLETSINEVDQDFLRAILPISYPEYLKSLFEHYLEHIELEPFLPMYSEAYTAYVSDFYKKNRIFFHNNLFMEENITKLRKDNFNLRDKRIIYNNDCFNISENTKLKHIIKGSRLKTDDNIPIGYTIYLPKGETVDSIIVKVYGGGEVFPLDMPYSINAALLDKKIAQVNLNLYDVLHLKDYQLKMDKNLHAIIHESINHFFNVIKNNPESLDPTLSILKGKKKFLFGYSFGGRTAIRHAQLYPNTFDGYISSEGVIDCMKDAKNTSLESIDRAKQYPWLDPALTIQSLSSPVLLMQNLDDTVVRSNCLFSFIRKAIEVKKAHLISFHITKESGFFHKTSDFYLKKLPNKGHSDSLIKKHFQAQFNAVYSFVTKDKQYEHPNLIEYKNYHYKKLSHKYPERMATLMKDIIAEGMEMFHFMSHKLTDINDLNIWECYYQPIFNAYYFACKGGEIKEQFAKLLMNNLLTEAVLSNTLYEILPTLHSFLQEYHLVMIPFPEIKDNVFLLNALRDTVYELHRTLKNNDEEKVRIACLKLLITFYRMNPSLLFSFNLSGDKFKSLKNDENEFKLLLTKVILKEKQLKKNAKEEAKTLGSLPVYYEEKENMKLNLRRNYTRL